MGFLYVAVAAVRALLRQRHIVPFIDPRRNAATCMPPMTPPRFASRLLRFADGFLLLPKWRRLASGLMAQLVNHTRQLFDLPLQIAVPFKQLLVGGTVPVMRVFIQLSSCPY
jgi:hypothetical protein